MKPITINGKRIEVYPIEDPFDRTHALATHEAYHANSPITQLCRLIDGRWTLPGSHLAGTLEAVLAPLLREPIDELSEALHRENLP